MHYDIDRNISRVKPAANSGKEHKSSNDFQFNDNRKKTSVQVPIQAKVTNYDRDTVNNKLIQLMSKTQAAALDDFDYGTGNITLQNDTQTQDGERLRVYLWEADEGSQTGNLEVHWHGDAYDESRINVRWENDIAQKGRQIPKGLLSVFKAAV
ncbi:MAG: hypothetical protein NE334_03970 [Lentisphaeraceae bacterium]|nr:hypothetical protein [Lentisphaeraceae bacterium]